VSLEGEIEKLQKGGEKVNFIKKIFIKKEEQ